MSNALDRLTINGFKSIQKLVNLELTNLNIIVGGNGAGKSNLISFFKMLRAIIDGNLNTFITDNGGAGDLLFNGRKVTKEMKFETRFDDLGYRFTLFPTPKDKCVIKDEALLLCEEEATSWRELGDSDDGASEMVAEAKQNNKDSVNSRRVHDAIASWQVYHFHDTTATAGMRHYEIVQRNKKLQTDASNIAPFLLRLKDKRPKAYKDILNAIRMVMPFFDDFLLEPQEAGSKMQVNLSWTQKGSDYPMQPYHLSDGSIRFICLATALLQSNPPSAIIIDEPELGLHPAAIVVLAELIQAASKKTQVIIATQSPALIDQFAIEDILVVNRDKGSSTFKRLEEKDFSEWLKDYSVGELWTKNVIDGGPVYE